MSTKAKKLTPFEEQVAREYVAGAKTKSEAYRAVALNGDKLKPSTIWVRASALFGQPHVQAFVEELRERVAKVANDHLEITAERVLKEYARIAFFDMRQLFDTDGKLVPIHELPDDAAAALQSVDVIRRKAEGESEIVLKYRVNAKQPALDKLAMRLNLFNEQEKEKEKDATLPEWLAIAVTSKTED